MLKIKNFLKKLNKFQETLQGSVNLQKKSFVFKIKNLESYKKIKYNYWIFLSTFKIKGYALYTRILYFFFNINLKKLINFFNYIRNFIVYIKDLKINFIIYKINTFKKFLKFFEKKIEKNESEIDKLYLTIDDPFFKKYHLKNLKETILALDIQMKVKKNFFSFLKSFLKKILYIIIIIFFYNIYMYYFEVISIKWQNNEDFIYKMIDIPFNINILDLIKPIIWFNFLVLEEYSITVVYFFITHNISLFSKILTNFLFDNLAFFIKIGFLIPFFNSIKFIIILKEFLKQYYSFQAMEKYIEFICITHEITRYDDFDPEFIKINEILCKNWNIENTKYIIPNVYTFETFQRRLNGITPFEKGAEHLLKKDFILFFTQPSRFTLEFLEIKFGKESEIYTHLYNQLYYNNWFLNFADTLSQPTFIEYLTTFEKRVVEDMFLLLNNYILYIKTIPIIYNFIYYFFLIILFILFIIYIIIFFLAKFINTLIEIPIRLSIWVNDGSDLTPILSKIAPHAPWEHFQRITTLNYENQELNKNISEVSENMKTFFPFIGLFFKNHLNFKKMYKTRTIINKISSIKKDFLQKLILNFKINYSLFYYLSFFTIKTIYYFYQYFLKYLFKFSFFLFKKLWKYFLRPIFIISFFMMLFQFALYVINFPEKFVEVLLTDIVAQYILKFINIYKEFLQLNPKLYDILFINFQNTDHKLLYDEIIETGCTVFKMVLPLFFAFFGQHCAIVLGVFLDIFEICRNVIIIIFKNKFILEETVIIPAHVPFSLNDPFSFVFRTLFASTPEEKEDPIKIFQKLFVEKVALDNFLIRNFNPFRFQHLANFYANSFTTLFGTKLAIFSWFEWSTQKGALPTLGSGLIILIYNLGLLQLFMKILLLCIVFSLKCYDFLIKNEIFLTFIDFLEKFIKFYLS